MSAHEDNLSGRDFSRLCAFIYSEAGICLGTEKKTMLEGRLKRRLRELEIDSYNQYCEYLFGEGRRQELSPSSMSSPRIKRISSVSRNTSTI